jgi:hypothetical protein
MATDMSRYRTKQGIVETELPNELILLDPETQQMFSLNATGCVAWRLLAGRTTREAVDALVARFDATPERAEADFDTLVADLLTAGLIEPVAGAA